MQATKPQKDKADKSHRAFQPPPAKQKAKAAVSPTSPRMMQNEDDEEPE
jgi:hypothetical protein